MIQDFFLFLFINPSKDYGTTEERIMPGSYPYSYLLDFCTEFLCILFIKNSTIPDLVFQCSIIIRVNVDLQPYFYVIKGSGGSVQIPHYLNW